MDEMEKKLDDLKEDYRRIEAPEFMASSAGFSPQALNGSVAPSPCQPKQLYYMIVACTCLFLR